MIELKNVSATTFYVGCTEPQLREIVKNCHLMSYEEVRDIFLVHFEELKDTSFVKKYESALKDIERSNSKGKEPVLYYTKGYEDGTLAYTDTQTTLNDLILSNVTAKFPYAYKRVKNTSIADIKHALSHCNRHGVNTLMNSVPNMGKSTILKLLDALDIYEKQVIRQSKLTSEREINLFTLDQEEKEKIVDYYLADIVYYLLLTGATEFVWGSMIPNRRGVYVDAVMKNTLGDINVKENLIKYITNYTTLPELHELKQGKTKVLDRFIVR